MGIVIAIVVVVGAVVVAVLRWFAAVRRVETTDGRVFWLYSRTMTDETTYSATREEMARVVGELEEKGKAGLAYKWLGGGEDHTLCYLAFRGGVQIRIGCCRFSSGEWEKVRRWAAPRGTGKK